MSSQMSLNQGGAAFQETTMMTTTYIHAVDNVDNAAIGLIGQKRKIYEIVMEPKKARKSPFTTKICDICKAAHYVPSAQKKCVDGSCCGILEHVKTDKVLKRPAPMCSKFCVVCDIMIEDIPTATKKCLECNNPLEKINKKAKVIHCKLVEKS
jgi:hypothetical protein